MPKAATAHKPKPTTKKRKPMATVSKKVTIEKTVTKGPTPLTEEGPPEKYDHVLASLEGPESGFGLLRIETTIGTFEFEEDAVAYFDADDEVFIHANPNGTGFDVVLRSKSPQQPPLTGRWARKA